MPFTIPLTPKQRARLAEMQGAVSAASATANAYTLAIVESATDAPEGWQGLSITDAGLVLGDAPAPSEGP